MAASGGDADIEPTAPQLRHGRLKTFAAQCLAAKRVTRRNRLVALAAQHEIPVN
jgi:hypothetical protein